MVPTSLNSPSGLGTAPRKRRLIVAGYSAAAVALVAFLTINGATGVPEEATFGTAGLLGIGLLLPAAGMLHMRRRVDSSQSAARNGFALQGLGLIGLLVGVVLVVVTSSLSGYLVGGAFIAAAGFSAIAGSVLLRGYFMSEARNTEGAVFLVLGTGLIFAGAGMIVASNIAFEYLISQVQNTVIVDIGATVSACGSVLSAYSFFILYDRSEAPASPGEVD